MTESVKVCCRVRPLNGKEQKSTIGERALSCNAAQHTVNLTGKGLFTYDRVFDVDTEQSHVYAETAALLVPDVFKGYNATIFAYGQTGSGKTWTMMGNPKVSSAKGVIPRLVEAVFEKIAQLKQEVDLEELQTEFKVTVSYVEIYMEQIQDLLNPTKTNLKLRESEKDGSNYIDEVTIKQCNKISDVMKLMALGAKNRSMAHTEMNKESSRSHSVFNLTLAQVEPGTGNKKTSNVYLVDLAGSERQKRTEASGQTLEEAKAINKSLAALGNVINALTEGQTHIPYRDSKLTRLLTDALGGNSKTYLIITCSPASSDLDETLSTLRFGSRAKKIKNSAKLNTEISPSELKKAIKELKSKVTSLQITIRELEMQNEFLKSKADQPTLMELATKLFVEPGIHGSTESQKNQSQFGTLQRRSSLSSCGNQKGSSSGSKRRGSIGAVQRSASAADIRVRYGRRRSSITGPSGSDNDRQDGRSGHHRRGSGSFRPSFGLSKTNKAKRSDSITSLDDRLEGEQIVSIPEGETMKNSSLDAEVAKLKHSYAKLEQEKDLIQLELEQLQAEHSQLQKAQIDLKRTEAEKVEKLENEVKNMRRKLLMGGTDNSVQSGQSVSDNRKLALSNEQQVFEEERRALLLEQASLRQKHAHISEKNQRLEAKVAHLISEFEKVLKKEKQKTEVQVTSLKARALDYKEAAQKAEAKFEAAQSEKDQAVKDAVAEAEKKHRIALQDLQKKLERGAQSAQEIEMKSLQDQLVMLRQKEEKHDKELEQELAQRDKELLKVKEEYSQRIEELSSKTASSIVDAVNAEAVSAELEQAKLELQLAKQQQVEKEQGVTLLKSEIESLQRKLQLSEAQQSSLVSTSAITEAVANAKAEFQKEQTKTEEKYAKIANLLTKSKADLEEALKRQESEYKQKLKQKDQEIELQRKESESSQAQLQYERELISKRESELKDQIKADFTLMQSERIAQAVQQAKEAEQAHYIKLLELEKAKQLSLESSEKARIDLLEQEKLDLNRRVTQLTKSNDLLKELSSQLTSNQKAHQQEVQRVRDLESAKVSEQTEQMSKLQLKLNQAEQNLVTLRSSHAELKSLLAETQKKHSVTLEKERQEYSVAKSTMESELTRLKEEAKKSAAKQQKEVLLATQKQSSEILQLKAENLRMRQAQEEARHEAEMAALEQQLQAAKHSTTGMMQQQNHSKLEAELSSLKLQLQVANQENETLKLQSMSSPSQTLSSSDSIEVSSLRQQLKLLQGELEDERTKNTRLSLAHTELQAKLHAKLSNAQSSGDPFNKQKEEVASLQNELSSAKKKIFEQSELLRNKEEKYLQDLQNLQKDLAAAMPASNGSREVELQKQVEQLTNKLSKQKDSLELELKLLRSETQSQISSYRSQIKFMEVKHAKELENEKGKVESATAKVAASEDSEMWENKMQNLQRKMGDLQKEIDETNDKYRKALAEAERASNSSKSLERQIEDLRRGHAEDLSLQTKRARSLEDALAAERKDHVSQLQLLQDLNAKQREQMIEKHEAEISSQREKTELGASARLQTAERELEDLQKEIRALRRDKEGLKRDKEALLRKSEQFLVEKQRALQELKFSRKEYQQIMEKYTELKASSAATSSLGSSSVITRLETSMQGSDPATLGHAIQHALSMGLKENHPVVTRAIARLRVLMGASR